MGAAPAPMFRDKPSGSRRAARVAKVLGVWLGVWLLVLLCWGAAGNPRETDPSGPAVGVRLGPGDWTQPEVCSDCHTTLYKQWTGTMHSMAATDPVYVSLYVLADKQTKGKAEEYCAASLCHSPVGRLLAEIPPVDGSRLSPISRRAVFCDFCHTVKGSKGVGNGRYDSAPGSVKRGPYADAQSPIHDTAYSKLHTSAEFCGMCHNVSHPKYGTKLETTYDEWKRSPYAKGKGTARRVCQDCHMGPKAPKVLGGQPGRAALTAPLRPNVFSHRVTGANVFMAGYLGDTSTASRAKAFLKSAARLSVSTGGALGDSVPVTVKITNIGAGHDLPTGVSELRQVWVELTLRDAQGVVRHSEGTLDSFGEVPKSSRIFHTVFGDRAGKPTDYIWFATKVLRDDRIPAKASRTVRFLVPATGVRRPARLTARLLYRSMPQYIADMTLGKGKVKVPAIEMAKATVVLR